MFHFAVLEGKRFVHCEVESGPHRGIQRRSELRVLTTHTHTLFIQITCSFKASCLQDHYIVMMRSNSSSNRSTHQEDNHFDDDAKVAATIMLLFSTPTTYYGSVLVYRPVYLVYCQVKWCFGEMHSVCP